MKEDKKKEKGEVTRRDFLIGGGAAVVGAAVGAGIAYPLASGGGGTETVTTTKVVTNTQTVDVPTTVTSTVPGGTVTSTVTQAATTVTKTVEVPVPGESAADIISLTVNGKPQVLQVEPEETLNYVLREKLGLTSIKDMCLGYGACGSCSVIVDGRPVLSCMLLAVECKGATIETAEGIADANHPLINTYIMNHCMQCGYCTPGFIVTAKALLDHNPNPSEEEIRDIMGGNICRCGTYPQHILAVQEAAESL